MLILVTNLGTAEKNRIPPFALPPDLITGSEFAIGSLSNFLQQGVDYTGPFYTLLASDFS
jgi:hypothetical protein